MILVHGQTLRPRGKPRSSWRRIETDLRAAGLTADVSITAYQWRPWWRYRSGYPEAARAFRQWLILRFGESDGFLLPLSHSAGGVLVREAVVQMEEEGDPTLERIPLAILLSPPLYGASIRIPRLAPKRLVDLSLGSRYLDELDQRLTASCSRGDCPRFVTLHRDYDWLFAPRWRITRAEVISPIGEHRHSEVGGHRAVTQDLQPAYQDLGGAESATAQAIVGAVHDARAGVPVRCLHCALDQLSDQASEAWTLSEWQALESRVDPVLVQFPNSRELLGLKRRVNWEIQRAR